MQFIDLATQQARIKEQIDARIQTVLAHGQYIMGPEVCELEEKLADYVGVKHAVACASGTDALLIALMAFQVGPGDAIFTTPFTFIATVEVIQRLGATPVFVDIDPVTFNMDPAKLESAIGAIQTGDRSLHPMPAQSSSKPTPRGIIAVDLFGLPAEYDQINAIANANDLFVIQDAAQSFGGQYKGRNVGGQAKIGCTSFFPAKPLGCYGDGGMCFVDNDELAAALSSIRVHGTGIHKYDNIRIGINGRLDTLQAAILCAKFEIFPEEVKLRNQVAKRYKQFLEPIDPLPITLPSVPSRHQSVWAQYSALALDEKHRVHLQNSLKENGIPTAIYYPKPLHLQTAFASLGYRSGMFLSSENCAKRIFSLPMHPYLKAADQEHIAEVMLMNES
jgi:dTDP-4-amino-4,6-dideoxygalactose transaminase